MLVRINILFKSKAKKVQSVDNISSDRSVLKGSINWKESRLVEAKKKAMLIGSYWDKIIISKFSDIRKGSCLISECLKEIFKRTETILNKAERDLLVYMFYQYEAALVWEFPYYCWIHSDIVLLQDIRTVEYKIWQKKAIPIPSALLSKYIEIFRDRIAKRILKKGYRLYRNS